MDAINRLINLDEDDVCNVFCFAVPQLMIQILQHIIIFDESTALQEMKSKGRIAVFPRCISSSIFSTSTIASTSTQTADESRKSTPKLDLLFRHPNKFVRDAKAASRAEGRWNTRDPASYFDDDELTSSIGVLVCAENHVKDRVKSAISSSSEHIKLHELEYTPRQSPSVADDCRPFDVVISSESKSTYNHNFS